MRMAWSGFPGDELAGAAPSCRSSPEVELTIGGLHLDHPVRLTHDRPGFFFPRSFAIFALISLDIRKNDLTAGGAGLPSNA
jgi:hypothetical protein